jgi:hypothetical protein
VIQRKILGSVTKKISVDICIKARIGLRTVEKSGELYILPGLLTQITMRKGGLEQKNGQKIGWNNGKGDAYVNDNLRAW